jgi:hypothetical protein
MSEVQGMLGNGEAEKETIQLDFNKSTFIDFVGACTFIAHLTASNQGKRHQKQA